MRTLFVSLLLCGCAGTVPEVFVPHNNVTVPNDLTYCPKPSDTIKPLPAIRTTDTVIDYANKLELSREELITDLQTCDTRRSILLNKLKTQ